MRSCTRTPRSVSGMRGRKLVTAVATRDAAFLAEALRPRDSSRNDTLATGPCTESSVIFSQEGLE